MILNLTIRRCLGVHYGILVQGLEGDIIDL